MKLFLLAVLLVATPRVDAEDALSVPAEWPPETALTYAPLRLKEVTTTPGGHRISHDASMSAVAGENAITVWSLPKGKPLFRIEAPSTQRVGPTDNVVFEPAGFSHDGRWLLAKIEHGRSNEARNKTSSEIQLVLVSIPDEKIVRTLATFDEPCGLDPYKCTELSAEFTADGRKVVAWGERGGREAGRYEQFLMALELDGRRLFDEVEVLVRKPGFEDFESPRPNAFMKTFVGFAADGRMIGVGLDDGSCALLDMTNHKRLAFLDGCTDRDAPQLRAEYGYLYSSVLHRGTVKLWGFDGALRGKVAAQPSDSRRALEPVGDGRYVLEHDNYIVSLGSGYDPAGSVKGAIWDTKSGNLLAATREDLLGAAYFARMTPDRRHIALPSDSAVIYASVDAGSPLERSAAPLAAKVAHAAPAAAGPAARGFDAPPRSSMKADPDAFAVIIGVEKYRQAGIPKVDFAARDARTMHAYATKAMGFDAKNVVLLTDEHATRTDFEKHLGSWLRNRVGAGSRVFVYYAGHGAPNPTTGEGYLMPYEADPNYLEDSAYPVARLYDSLSKLPTKDVTVVLDACFSGQGGRSLLAKGARPLVVAKTASSGANTVVLAAAQGTQISASDPERRHGLLTSYLLEALHGGADADKDGNITSAEVFAFVRPAVERAARLQNLEQTPTMTPSLEELKARPGRPWLSLGK